MAETPKAAVIIPTHNRADILARVLDSIAIQTVPCETFVMDDACSDGTAELVRQRYPNVRYYREDIGKGPTFERNKAAEMTSAPYLFTIDDDCILQSPHTIQQTIDAFDHPRVGAVTIPFINVLQNQSVRSAAPDSTGLYVTHDYYGGMVALRRDVFIKVGSYRSFMFIQVEEPDLAIRMLDAGYVVRLGWADPLHHLESPKRNHDGRDMQGPRNHILYSFYNVPWPYFPAHLAGTTLNCLRYSMKTGRLRFGLRGTWKGFAGIIHERRNRRPVSSRGYQLMRLLKQLGSAPLEQIEPLLPPMARP